VKEAIEVYLAACNRLYTSAEWMNHYDVAVPPEYKQLFLPDATVAVIAGILADFSVDEIAKGIAGTFRTIESREAAQTYQDYFDGKAQSNRNETEASSVIARVENYKHLGYGFGGDNIARIMARENAWGVELVITYLYEDKDDKFTVDDFVSYRGDYSIRWAHEFRAAGA
jgi:hypothetical protein